MPSRDSRVRIRCALESDFEQLFSLYRQLYCFESKFDGALKSVKEVEENLRRYLRRCLKGKTHVVLVAEAGNNIVGFIMVAVRRYSRVYRKPKFGYVDALFVSETARKRGIGRKLLREAERTLLRAGISSLECEVYEGNDAAMEFYRSCGFRTISKRLRKEI